MFRVVTGLGGGGWRLVAAAALVPSLLSCGGRGGDSWPEYALSINGGEVQSTSSPDAFLTGTGFLPPGSTCPDGCSGLLPPPVYGNLGSHELRWANAATGGSGDVVLTWQCNCGGSDPSWMTTVPVQPGANPITVTMRADGYEQQATVLVMRQ